MTGLRQTLARLTEQQRRLGEAQAVNGQAPARSLRRVRDFGSNPGELRMLTHVPRHLPKGSPLVVVLHGCGQTAAGHDMGSGWSELADRYGFAALFPEQRTTNNPNTCFSWFAPDDVRRDRGEAHSIRQMIDQMHGKHTIDPSRIYVTGLSAGGAMANALLANYPEVFAAGAIVAGLPFGSATTIAEALETMSSGGERTARHWGDFVRTASRHEGPWPRLSIWQGTSDLVVHPSNADAVLAQWLNVHGLKARPSSRKKVGNHVRRVWRSAGGAELVEAYTIEGMGHGVPIDLGTDAGAAIGAESLYHLDAGISSSERIAEFWGLSGEAARRGNGAALRKANGNGKVADTEAHAAEPAPVLPDTPAEAAATAAHGNHRAIITEALRIAGLLDALGPAFSAAGLDGVDAHAKLMDTLRSAGLLED
jgi:poly(hydroxyalkanoate) depolymerase family esterase